MLQHPMLLSVHHAVKCVQQRDVSLQQHEQEVVRDVLADQHGTGDGGDFEVASSSQHVHSPRSISETTALLSPRPVPKSILFWRRTTPTDTNPEAGQAADWQRGDKGYMVVLCTYRAAGLEFGKYTVDGYSFSSDDLPTIGSTLSSLTSLPCPA